MQTSKQRLVARSMKAAGLYPVAWPGPEPAGSEQVLGRQECQGPHSTHTHGRSKGPGSSPSPRRRAGFPGGRPHSQHSKATSAGEREPSSALIGDTLCPPSGFTHTQVCSATHAQSPRNSTAASLSGRHTHMVEDQEQFLGLPLGSSSILGAAAPSSLPGAHRRGGEPRPCSERVVLTVRSPNQHHQHHLRTS